jgi:hypothetical protein
VIEFTSNNDRRVGHGFTINVAINFRKLNFIKLNRISFFL